MAAGLGFKTFNTGEVLSASDVNGYLMQGVLVFASATARDAAITSPQEGQFAYTKDTNGLWYYDGAAWVASGATGDIEGVTAGTGISGGGTSGTVTITNSMATAIDAKGDLVAGTGADAFARLAVGSNDQVLTADSTTATGLKWASPASGGGLTLLSTTTLSGTSTTIGSISQSYTNLFVLVYDVDTSGQAGLNYEITSEGGICTYNWLNNGNLGKQTNRDGVYALGQGGDQTNSANSMDLAINFYNYSTSQNKTFDCVGNYVDWTTGANYPIWNGGVMKTSTAISSLTFFLTGGPSFEGGTVKIYGVK